MGIINDLLNKYEATDRLYPVELIIDSEDLIEGIVDLSTKSEIDSLKKSGILKDKSSVRNYLRELNSSIRSDRSFLPKTNNILKSYLKRRRINFPITIDRVIPQGSTIKVEYSIPNLDERDSEIAEDLVKLSVYSSIKDTEVLNWNGKEFV